MKISILLPLKENFSPSYAGAVSLFINDTLKFSKFKTQDILFSKNGYALGSSYLEFDDNKIYLASGNGIFAYSEFNGKIVISYWATWCAPCIKEMPSIKRAEEILEDYGYTFLLVSDETISKISNFNFCITFA